MSKSPITALCFALLTIPASAFAAPTTLFTVIDTTINIVGQILPILLMLMIVVFFWGIIKFIYHADDEKAVEEGKMMMVWGMVGIAVVALLWGIVGYLQQSLGLNVVGAVGNSPEIPTSIPAT